MDPIRAPLRNVMSQQSFKFLVGCHHSGRIRLLIKAKREGKRDDHCINSIIHLSCLIHSKTVTEEHFAHFYRSGIYSIKVIDPSTNFFYGRINIRNVMHRFAAALIDENPASEAFAHKMKQVVPILGRRERKVFQSKFERCRRAWNARKTDHLNSFAQSLRKLSKRIRRLHWDHIRQAVIGRVDELSTSRGFMHYIVVETNRGKRNPNVHAFALEQVVGNGECPEYYLWQSWYQEYDILAPQGYKVLLEGSIETFFGDLTTIFKKTIWDERSDRLWKKWFHISLYSKIPSKMETIECTPDVISMKAISFSTASLPFNPQNVEHSIHQNHQFLLLNSEPYPNKKRKRSQST